MGGARFHSSMGLVACKELGAEGNLLVSRSFCRGSLARQNILASRWTIKNELVVRFDVECDTTEYSDQYPGTAQGARLFRRNA